MAHVSEYEVETRFIDRLAKLQKDKEKCESERFSNVDRFMAGELEKDDYQRIRAELTHKAELLDKQIAEVSAKLHESGAAADDGVRDAVSTMLAVQKANYAVRMYENVGFKTVDANDEEYIMVCEL